MTYEYNERRRPIAIGHLSDLTDDLIITLLIRVKYQRIQENNAYSSPYLTGVLG